MATEWTTPYEKEKSAHAKTRTDLKLLTVKLEWIEALLFQRLKKDIGEARFLNELSIIFPAQPAGNSTLAGECEMILRLYNEEYIAMCVKVVESRDRKPTLDEQAVDMLVKALRAIRGAHVFKLCDQWGIKYDKGNWDEAAQDVAQHALEFYAEPHEWVSTTWNESQSLKASPPVTEDVLPPDTSRWNALDYAAYRMQATPSVGFGTNLSAFQGENNFVIDVDNNTVINNPDKRTATPDERRNRKFNRPNYYKGFRKKNKAASATVTIKDNGIEITFG